MSTVRPTPTKLKILRGNPGKQRLNRAEPQFKIEPLSEPPKFLDKLAKQEWQRVALELHRYWQRAARPPSQTGPDL
jgi:phage terminase small subunit